MLKICPILKAVSINTELSVLKNSTKIRTPKSPIRKMPKIRPGGVTNLPFTQKYNRYKKSNK